VPLADYIAGLAFLAVTAGASIAAGVLLQRRRLPHLAGVPRVLAVAVLATAALAAAHLLPGLVGLLSRWSAAGVAVALAAGAWRLRQVPGAARPPVPPEEGPRAGETTVSWGIAFAAAGAVGLWLVASAWNRTVLPPEGIDTLTFHLPNVAGWLRSGTFWRIDQFSPLLANGNYPQTGDLTFLAAVQPWRNDWLAGAVNPLYIALAGLAVYAAAAELGAPRPAAMLAGSLFATLPVVGLAANGEAMTDSQMFATMGAGALFLLREARGAPRSELWLAALALGLAFGTKWYSVWAVGAVLLVWLVARRPSIPHVALPVGGIVALAGGFWLVRNLVESGNPVFPVELSALGVTLFDAPRDLIRECSGFTISDYVGDWDVWADHILPAYEETYALPGAVLGAGLIAAVALALRERGALLAGAACVALLALGYAFTPYSAFGPEGEPLLVGANARYLLPALLVAAPLAAVALGRARRLRVPLELVALAAVAHGIERSFDVTLGVVAAVLTALALLAGLVWLGAMATARIGRRRPRLAARAAAVALLVAALVAVGHARQREFNDGRYESGDPAIAWIAQNAPEHQRIALAGVWSVEGRSPVWPAFGERLRNEVDYLGQFVDEQLREYSRRDRWAAALRRGRYDLLLVGRGGYARDYCPLPGQDSDDDRWARAEGLEILARSDRLTLYRVPGR
jgi:hypothetical protein